APAIGIDGTVEGNIRRTVAGDDGARLLDLYFGLERRQFLQRVPAVVEDVPGDRLVSSGRVDARCPAAPPVEADTHAALVDQRIRQRCAALGKRSGIGLSDRFHSRLHGCDSHRGDEIIPIFGGRTKQELSCLHAALAGPVSFGYVAKMLSVVIETRNQEEALARTLASLVGGAVE